MTGRGRRLILFSAYSTMAMLGIYITLYQYTILSISELFSLNAAVMGLLVGAQHAGMALPPLFLGVLRGKVGKKRVVLISYCFLVPGTFLAGVTDGPLLFVTSIVIIGAGFSVAEATVSAVLADEFEGESNRHLNFSQVAFSIGALMGPFIAQFLIGKGIYFKDLYAFCSVIFLLLGVVFYFTKHSHDIPSEQGSVAPEGIFQGITRHISGFVKSRVLLLLAAGIFLYVGIENTIASFSDSYFEVMLKSPALSAAALALFWGSMIPSRFLAGLIRIKQKKVFVVLSVLLAVFLVTAMLVNRPAYKIIFFALSGFACGPLWPYLMDSAAVRNHGSSGPALNIMFSFCSLGGALLPVVSGLIAKSISLSAVYFFCATAALVMIVVWLTANRSKAVI